MDLNINSLPAEIIENILSCLNNKTLRKLAEVSKAMHEKVMSLGKFAELNVGKTSQYYDSGRKFWSMEFDSSWNLELTPVKYPNLMKHLVFRDSVASSIPQKAFNIYVNVTSLCLMDIANLDFGKALITQANSLVRLKRLKIKESLLLSSHLEVYQLMMGFNFENLISLILEHSFTENCIKLFYQFFKQHRQTLESLEITCFTTPSESRMFLGAEYVPESLGEFPKLKNLQVTYEPRRCFWSSLSSHWWPLFDLSSMFESLRMNLDYVDSDRIAETIMPRSRSLEVLQVSKIGPNVSLNLFGFLKLRDLSLKFVTSLDFTIDFENTLTSRFQQRIVLPTSLQKLTLESCCIHKENLAMMVKGLKQLKFLKLVGDISPYNNIYNNSGLNHRNLLAIIRETPVKRICVCGGISKNTDHSLSLDIEVWNIILRKTKKLKIWNGSSKVSARDFFEGKEIKFRIETTQARDDFIQTLEILDRKYVEYVNSNL